MTSVLIGICMIVFAYPIAISIGLIIGIPFVLIGTLSLALAHRIFIGPTEKFDAQSVMNKIRDEAAPLIGRIALFSSVLIGIALIAKGVIE
ncbi:hypothetical protein [Sutterella wadsworthensis]|uniref:hypothetical protein n=1 Tax=Sutterella wadsworthensis TaxID=40545 RepID=UPI00205BBCA8|nr:MAG TPA: hypothetical protein [Caudoviricetes sp.]